MPAGAFMCYIQINNKKASAMGFLRELKNPQVDD